MLQFFEVETTGLLNSRNATYNDVDNRPRIASVSWALFEPSGCMCHQREAVIRSEGFETPKESTRVHGITTTYASEHGTQLKAVLEDMTREIRQEQPALLIAHNMEFERNVVMLELYRAGMEQILEGLPVYCTMERSVDICRIPCAGGGYKWPRLEELYALLFGEGFSKAHNAAADVLACARCSLPCKTTRSLFQYQRRLRAVLMMWMRKLKNWWSRFWIVPPIIYGSTLILLRASTGSCWAVAISVIDSDRY